MLHLTQRRALRQNEKARREAAAHLEVLLRRRNNPVIVEHALWLKSSITDARQERKRLLHELAEVNPHSGFLNILGHSVLGRLEAPPRAPTPDGEQGHKPPLAPQEPKATSPVPLLGDAALLILAVGAAVWLRRRKRTAPP